MITASRQILVLGLMLAAMIAAAAALSADRAPRGPVGVSAPSLPRSGEPLAAITARQFELRWSALAGDIRLASR